MCKQEYEELQNWLSYKMEHSPYHISCSNYNSGWKEAMLVVKSKIKSMYKEE
jgi:hypothetical protein